jgi:hypothetical protein
MWRFEMQPLLICDVAKIFVEPHLQSMQYACTFSRNDPKYVRNWQGIDDSIQGIYFFYEKGRDVKSNPANPIYIGESTSAIKKRLVNHKKSLNQPEWKTELTGRKFIANDLDLDMDIDVYYIEKEKLGITCRKSSAAAENLFMHHLKPIVWK